MPRRQLHTIKGHDAEAASADEVQSLAPASRTSAQKLLSRHMQAHMAQHFGFIAKTGGKM